MRTNNKSYNLSIQGLKGIAALVVFFSHSLNIIQNNIVQEIGKSPLHLFFDGQCSVIIFFVISGFFYYREKVIDKTNYIKLIKKKIIRIYPAYIITLCIAFILCNLRLSYNHSICTSWANQFWQHDVSFITFIKQIPIITPGFDPNILNFPVWYLRAEIRMLFVMPLIITLFLFLKERYRKLPSFVFLLPLLLSSLAISGMICFMIGYISRLIAEKNDINKLRNMWPVFIIIGLFLLNIRNEFIFNTTEFSNAIQAVGASILLVYSYYIGGGILKHKILVFLGDISYEIFLVHSIVLLFLRCFIEDYYLFVCISFLITIPSSILINKLQNKFTKCFM